MRDFRVYLLITHWLTIRCPTPNTKCLKVLFAVTNTLAARSNSALLCSVNYNPCKQSNQRSRSGNLLATVGIRDEFVKNWKCEVMSQLLQFKIIYTVALYLNWRLWSISMPVSPTYEVTCLRYQRHLASYVAVDQMWSVAVPMLSNWAMNGENA